MFRLISIVLVAIFATGCASTGQYNGMQTKDPFRWMIVHHSLERNLTQDQKQMAGDVIREAAKIVERQLTGADEAIAAGAFSGAIGSAVATALTVSGPLGSVMAIEAAQNAASGVNDARVTVSYARVYAAATIAENLIRDRVEAKVKGYEILRYVRIVPAFIRSNNTQEDFK